MTPIEVILWAFAVLVVFAVGAVVVVALWLAAEVVADALAASEKRDEADA